MPLYAGLDRSGTPDLVSQARGHDPYVVCVAAIESDSGDLETLRDACDRVRAAFQMSRGQEFHGHTMKEAMITALLEAVMPLNLIVGALLIDKEATRRGRDVADLPDPRSLQEQAALALLAKFLVRHPLAGLWCDEDIKGKERQKAFTKAVRRMQRAAWPNTPITVRHKASDTSDLIQLADVSGYALAHEARGGVKTKGLRTRLMALRRSEANVILGPKVWEE